MERAETKQPPENHPSLSDFLPFARDKGIRISAPEWMNFLGVAETIGQTELVDSGDFYDTLKSVGSATLVKDKAEIATYSDAFDEFFYGDMPKRQQERYEQKIAEHLAGLDENTFSELSKLLKAEKDYESEITKVYYEYTQDQDKEFELTRLIAKIEQNFNPTQKSKLKDLTKESPAYKKARREEKRSLDKDFRLGSFAEQHSKQIEAETERRSKERKAEKDLGKIAMEVADAQIRESKIGEKPEIKEQLGITEVDEDINTDLKEDHDDNEHVHGGDKDQHNDILLQTDESKDGGGDKGNNVMPGDGDQAGNSSGKGKSGTKEGKGKGKGKDGDMPGEGEGSAQGGTGETVQNQTGHAQDGVGMVYETDTGHAYDGIAKEKSEFGVIGNAGGKGKYKVATGYAPEMAERLIRNSQIRQFDLSENIRHHDRRERYNVRPNRTDVAEIVKNLRRIITDVSDAKSHTINIRHTVDNFAKKDFRFDYEREREIKSETVLFIDVGGPVDEWRPLMEELSQGMSRGLLKLEVYLFHNQLYGYCWNPKDGNYARQNGLKSVRDIVKKRKKVIIYGDADMSWSEIEHDNYPPRGNEEKIARYGMEGTDCLEYIKRNSENVVWINPIFKSSWYYDPYHDEYDTNNSVGQISDIIQMYDLSIGGVQDAIADLMRK